MPKRTNEQDIITVQNIDLDCDAIDSDTGISHREYFQVKWDGVPFRIKPGETRQAPRYLAEHYAKHLADHILFKREEDEKRPNLINNTTERGKVVSQILVGVDELFLGDEEVVKEPEPTIPMRKKEEVLDLGKVPNKAMGNTMDTDTTPKDTPATTEKGKAKAKPTREELVAECDKLDIKYDNKDKVDDLMDKIAKF